MDLWNSI